MQKKSEVAAREHAWTFSVYHFHPWPRSHLSDDSSGGPKLTCQRPIWVDMQESANGIRKSKEDASSTDGGHDANRWIYTHSSHLEMLDKLKYTYYGSRNHGKLQWDSSLCRRKELIHLMDLACYKPELNHGDIMLSLLGPTGLPWTSKGPDLAAHHKANEAF